MHKTFLKIFIQLFVLSLFALPLRFVFAEDNVSKPFINTNLFAPNYHHYIDTYYQDDDDRFSIIGSNFGATAGKIVNLENNNELITQNWSDNSIKIYTKENIGKLLLGVNQFILKTSEGVDSDPFTITFEKYWIGPNILSINPAVIHLGDQVEITGENFGDSQPTDCPVIPSIPAVPVQVACGLRDGNNRPQKIVSWSNNKIIAIIDNTNIASKIPISIVVHPFISNNDRTGGGKSGYIEVLAQSCTSNDWSCTNWSSCSSSGTQTRTCSKTSNCEGGTQSPVTSQSCAYTPACTANSWSCGDWGNCSSNGIKSRTCSKISNCEGGTQSPATAQSCTYTPPCSSDTWQCGSWGTCSPQGVQTRSCNKTFDCPSAETAAPATSQYCEAPNQPKQQSPTEYLGIANQSSIIKATVKLICPVSRTMASQGSGTVINSAGLILTNKHVIDGTAGCLVGFINDYGDEPYFNDRQIADIYKISNDEDVAILKLRNSSNSTITAINIANGNSGNLRLGDMMTTYGYPAKFGTKLTYTSGDFSGVDGNYLKTTAIIEHGNSGGGAYLKNGNFMGIPTAVMKGDLNSMGYVLSVNKINSWLNNSAIAYNSGSNNNYSRVSSILEDIDLSTLNSLNLYIAENKTETQKVIEQEKSLVTKADEKLSKRVSGNILLQVESKGEGWYVNPDNKKKYYLGKPADAFSIMRNLGLGIKHSELSGYLNLKFPSRLSGKIMLDVEKKGEAYYVNPKDMKGYFLNKPSDAFQVMRNLGLGITNMDIRKIEVGETE